MCAIRGSRREQLRLIGYSPATGACPPSIVLTPASPSENLNPSLRPREIRSPPPVNRDSMALRWLVKHPLRLHMETDVDWGTSRVGKQSPRTYPRGCRPPRRRKCAMAGRASHEPSIEHARTEHVLTIRRNLHENRGEFRGVSVQVGSRPIREDQKPHGEWLAFATPGSAARKCLSARA